MHSVLSSDSDHTAATNRAIISNGLVIFNVHGDCQILSLCSECYTANDSTASRVKYVVQSALDGATDITGTSASLASATVGTAIICDNTSLSSAPNVVTSGVWMNMDSRGIRIPRGDVRLTVTGGSTTGLWRHYIRYEPLENGAYISPAF
jgi:hypothetical protein